MAEEKGQERTEEPTPKRQLEARGKGQVPRSRELTTAMVLLAGSATVLLAGDRLGGGLFSTMRAGLRVDRAHIFDEKAMLEVFGNAIVGALSMLAPLFVVVVVAAILAPMALGGFSFSTKALGPKFDKLNPVKGLGRIFAVRGLVELSKALAKFLLIASVGAALLWYFAREFVGLGTESLESAIAHMGSMLQQSFVILAASLLVIAAVDIPFQLWDHKKQLRMTRQEIKDEMKETDGRPEVKARLRALQRELSQGRMMEEVPQADVVITNPTHFAVALKYDMDSMGAPRVVAKGADLVAARIRSIAVGADVPLFSAPPLARAIYHNVEVGKEIPGGLYVAVAQILAYVYQVRDARLHGVDEPQQPTDITVPDEFLGGPGRRRTRH